jgi:hypothetical protein
MMEIAGGVILAVVILGVANIVLCLVIYAIGLACGFVDLP